MKKQVANFMHRQNYSLISPRKGFCNQVKAKKEDGFGVILLLFNFDINPPFYKTWWFRLSLIALSFKVNILAYNKHIQQEILKRVLKKLGKKFYLLIEVNKRHVRINQNAILFVESFRNYVEINTNNKKYLYRSTMNGIEEKLSSINFIRTHRSFIVQKDKIDSISEVMLTMQNHQIPIGKTYQKKLMVLKNQFASLNN